MTLSAEKKAVLEEARRRLEPHGWRVSLEERPALFMLHLEHDLTSAHNIVFELPGSDPEERLVTALAQQEFHKIEEAPHKAENSALLGALRTLAAGSRWPSPILGEVAVVLHRHKVLSEAEADWLQRAGPAWAVPAPEG